MFIFGIINLSITGCYNEDTAVINFERKGFGDACRFEGLSGGADTNESNAANSTVALEVGNSIILSSICRFLK